MANTDRRILDDEGKQFMPMNMEGTLGDDNFITLPKFLTIGCIFGALVGWLIMANSSGYSFMNTLIVFLILLWISSILLRYIVFEERLYYKMYEELKKGRVIKPDRFWNIASKSKSSHGTALIYNDAKIGVIVRLERDIITGKGEGVEENHYDAVSDFYKYLNSKGIKRVFMNIMEPTGKDERLAELDKLCNATDNYNINRLVELSVTHIKNISNNTLTDVEYYLLYTDDIMGQDSLIDNVEEAMSILMSGAYASYEILGTLGDREINEFARQINFVDYFNTDEAALRIFKANGMERSSLRISKIKLSNGRVIDIDPMASQAISNISSTEDLKGKTAAEFVGKVARKEITRQAVDLDEIEKIYVDNTTSYDNNDNSNNGDDEIDF